MIQASVLIPHFNDVDRLKTCLAALTPQIHGQSVEIVVCDNGSSQDLSQIKAAFPEVRFVQETSPGAAAARNRAVTESQGEWLFFTDADCVPAADWIEAALHHRTPKTVVGGRITLFDETPPPRTGAEAFETVFAFPQESYITKKHYSVTANMLVSRELFGKVGPFDGTRSEDMDWGQRAHAMGVRIVYAPDLTVAHPTRQDWPALLKKWRRITQEMYFAHGVTAKKRLVWGLRSLAILASIPVHSAKILRHPDLQSIERWRALGVLVRLRVLRTGWTIGQALLGAPPIQRPQDKATNAG